MIKQGVIGSILIFCLFISFNSFGQEFSKSSIKLGLGIGIYMGPNTDGGGFIYSVGYQREIWKDRLRLNPNFSMGRYSSKMVLDARDQYFNSTNMAVNLYFDLIKIKSFSLVVGVGGLVNNSRGLMGTGGDTASPSNPQTSEYFSFYRAGGYLGVGFRVNKPNERTSVNIMPLNLHIGNDLGEVYAKVELDIKF